MNDNKIRSLNYIFTYGPGSIYELPNNQTVMILGLDFWKNPEKNKELYKEIYDVRLKSRLRKEKLYQPPDSQTDYTNGNDKKESAYIPAAIFPDWHVCKRCNRLFRYSQYKNKIDNFRQEVKFITKRHNIYKEIPSMFCPFCMEKNNILTLTKEETKKLWFSEIYSFSWVVICKNGHIDNPDLYKLFKIENDLNNRESIKFEFKSTGIGLDKQEIWTHINGKPVKKSIAKLYQLYNEKSAEMICTGKRYWLKDGNEKKCDCKNTNNGLRLVKKGDSLVYFPRIITSLSIPFFNYEEETRQIENIIDTIQIISAETDNEYVKDKLKASVLKESSVEYKILIRKASRFIKSKHYEEVNDISMIENKVKLDFKGILLTPENNPFLENKEGTIDEKIFRKEEYKKLIQNTNDENHDPPFSLTAFKSPSSLPFLNTLSKVDDVSITHVVTGFSRVYPSYQDEKIKIQKICSKKQSWLPAIQVRGEGIFIDFNNTILKKWEESNKVFFSKRNSDFIDVLNAIEKYNFIFDIDKNNINIFYLLHSFSHYLINVLSFFSGFNAASMRERIYFHKSSLSNDDKSSKSVYGILISTSSGGTEASLGGLARYGDEKMLLNLLKKTLCKLKTCSNDPLCLENKPKRDNYNFSACFSCLYLPETSCELGNNFLDRQLLIGEGDGKESIKGFLSRESDLF